MKCFALILFVLLCLVFKVRLSVVVPWDELTKPYHEGCVQNSNVNPLYVVDYPEIVKYQDDPAVHCYIACIYQMIGVLDGKGEIIVDAIVNQLFPYIGPVEKCKADLQGITETCLKAYKLMLCLRTAVPDIYEK